MNKEKSIDVLNSLLEINNDRIEGYQTASKETGDPELKALFKKFILTSENCKQQLITEIRRLDGTPVEGTRVTGKFFRVWMDMKAALTNGDRKAILNSCEFGEDAAVETYHKAIRNNLEDITVEQQAMMNAQYALIKADHDKVKSLRDRMMVQSH